MTFFCLPHQSSFIEIELTLRIYAQEIRSVISVGRQACQTDGEEIGVRVSEGLSDPTKIQTRERDRPTRGKSGAQKSRRGNGGVESGGCGVQGRAVIQPAALFHPVGGGRTGGGFIGHCDERAARGL